MPDSKRKIRRQNIKRKNKIILVSIIFLIILGVGIYIFRNLLQKPLYISPLPPNYKIDSVSDKDQKLKLLEDKLKESKIKYEKIIAYDKYFIIEMEDDSKVLVSSQKDLIPQISSLQFILSRLTMEGKAVRELDLRFDKPVIRLK
jgi:uncharacterized membrane protein YvbJ